jgi:Arc/MetJ family transcription regulator
MRDDRETARTNIVLDKHLVDAGLRLTGLKTRRELVDLALRELVRHARQKKLLALKGRIDWDGDLDAMRTDVPADKPTETRDKNPG